MKDFRGMKRQRGRNRKPSGNSNNPNRAYESNGPEGTKVRGNAQTIYEKYQQLARDANASGDRVLAENHLQHAEHYFRLIRQMQPQRPVSEFVQRDPFSNGFDDFDDEMEADAAADADNAENTDAQAEPEARDVRDRNRDRNRGDRERDNRDRNENRNFQRDGQRDASRDGQRDGQREDDNGNRRETRRERYERRRAQRLQDQEKNLNGAEDDSALPPYASPSAIASTEPLGVSKPARDEAHSESRSDADHLPAFLRTPVASAPVADPEPEVAEEAPKPRRGRRKKAEEVSAEEA